MDKEKKKLLKDMAEKIRIDIVEMLCEAGSGHSGGSLSIADVFAYLYFSGEFNLDPSDPEMPGRDRIVLSKGHACPVLYAALAERGYFDRKHLLTLRKFNSILQGHPDMKKTPGVDITTGSLGQGLSCAVGMAIGARLDNMDLHVVAIVGDGECNEGQIWEAAMAAAHFGLGNLTAVLDRNGLQIDGPTKDIMDTEPIIDKWRSFAWGVIEIDGHDLDQIDSAFKKAMSIKDKPVCIVANTIKGKGVSFMENVVDFHGRAPTKEEAVKALKELE